MLLLPRSLVVVVACPAPSVLGIETPVESGPKEHWKHFYLLRLVS
jgi:hypothetical protein